ncbi:MAG: co-chaperone GroES [Proteobacteria bacterium]|jgi:chaperonin GroES|nr:co-chaperone GroES [Pseudomonadota bacterium]
MQIRPLYDRILVKRLEDLTKTAGGLFLPESATEKPSEGVVLAVGAGRLTDEGLRPLALKVGDRVAFGKYSGTEIKIDGEERLVMREDEVLGIIDTKE